MQNNTAQAAASSVDAQTKTTSSSQGGGTLVRVNPDILASDTVSMKAGVKYLLDFKWTNVAGIITENGNLVVLMTNGQKVVLEDFLASTKADTPATLVFEQSADKAIFFKLLQGLDMDPKEEPVEEVKTALASPASMEDIAEQVAQVEPAAGNNGRASSRTSGFGFGSAFEATDMETLDITGPLGNTEYSFAANSNIDNSIGEVTEIAPAPVVSGPGPIGRDVDESDMNGGTTSASGTAANQLGNDASSVFYGNGTVNTNGLTFNGQPITVGYNASTGVYTGIAGGTTIFTLTINSNGSYDFILFENVDHPNINNHNDRVEITFGVVAEETNGDTESDVITIGIRDDGVDAVNDVSGFSQNVTDTVTGNALSNDNLSEDSPNTITQVSFGGTTVNVPAAGSVTINGAHGVLTISADGSYTYVLNTTGQNNQTDSFTYTLQDGDGDTDTATITITGTGQGNDVPVISGPAGVEVDETNMNGASTSASGTVTANFGGDGPGTFTGNGTVNLNGLTHNGQAINVTYNNGVYTGTAGGSTIFTLTINSNGSYTFNLLDSVDHPNAANHNDRVEITFGVVATDSDGDTDTNVITIGINDDGVTAVNDTSNFDQNTTTTVTGNALNNDNLSEDTANTVTQVSFGGTTVNVPSSGSISINGANGVLTISANGSYSYTLNSTSNNNQTDSFTYTLQDGDGDTDTATITITGTGLVDDVPVVTDPSAITVDETNMNGASTSANGTVTANFGGDGPGSFTGNGNVNLNGLTHNGQAINVTYNNGVYTGTSGGSTIFTLTINSNGSYTFNLLDSVDHPNANNHNDTVNISFGVTATDSDGDTDTGTISININDDGVTAINDTSTFDQNSTTSVTGNALSNDNLSEDSPNTITQVSFGGTTVNVPSSGSVTINGAHGVLTISANGSYSYTLNSTSQSNLTDTFTYTLRDGDGDTDTATISITGTGVADDNPVVTDPSAISVDESNLGASTSASGTVTANFGGDGPGTFTGNGTVNLNGLTHNGQAINVTYNNGVYTGTSGGSTIFTLTINSNGSYTFNLLDSVDHPNTSNHNDSVNITFGVTAQDSDGDTDTGTISINIFDDGVTATDDTANVPSGDMDVSGNVMTNDNLGADDPHAITQIQFGGNTLNIPNGGSVNIDGTYGTLTINSDGSYTYTLDPVDISLNPNAGSVAGNSDTINLNGFILENLSNQDLNWVSGPDGSGIGTGGNKISGNTDHIAIGFAATNSVTVTLADIGSNDLDAGIDFVINFTDGTQVNYEYIIANGTVVNGMLDITLTSDMFGGREINAILIHSTDTNSALDSASFLLNNISVPDDSIPDNITETFTYTITDGDGDTDTGTITINADTTNLSTTTTSGTTTSGRASLMSAYIYEEDTTQDAINDFVGKKSDVSNDNSGDSYSGDLYSAMNDSYSTGYSDIDLTKTDVSGAL